MPNPGDTQVFANCPCCGSSSSSSSSSSSGGIVCCPFDANNENCIYATTAHHSVLAICHISETQSIGCAIFGGNFGLAAIECNAWQSSFGCFTAFTGIFYTIIAVLNHNIWTVTAPCIGFGGACAGPMYVGSAACAGSGTTVTLTNTGTVSVTCPATITATLTW